MKLLPISLGLCTLDARTPRAFLRTRLKHAAGAGRLLAQGAWSTGEQSPYLARLTSLTFDGVEQLPRAVFVVDIANLAHSFELRTRPLPADTEIVATFEAALAGDARLNIAATLITEDRADADAFIAAVESWRRPPELADALDPTNLADALDQAPICKLCGGAFYDVDGGPTCGGCRALDGGTPITSLEQLRTTQCPLCLHSVDGLGFIGECPSCHFDTRIAVRAIRTSQHGSN